MRRSEGNLEVLIDRRVLGAEDLARPPAAELDDLDHARPVVLDQPERQAVARPFANGVVEAFRRSRRLYGIAWGR